MIIYAFLNVLLIIIKILRRKNILINNKNNTTQLSIGYQLNKEYINIKYQIKHNKTIRLYIISNFN